MEVLKAILDLGFTIASAIAGGVFICILLRYILAGVVDDVKGLNSLAESLNNRIRAMNNNLMKVDSLLSTRFGLSVDIERLSRSEGKDDVRRD